MHKGRIEKNKRKEVDAPEEQNKKTKGGVELRVPLKRTDAKNHHTHRV